MSVGCERCIPLFKMNCLVYSVIGSFPVFPFVVQNNRIRMSIQNYLNKARQMSAHVSLKEITVNAVSSAICGRLVSILLLFLIFECTMFICLVRTRLNQNVRALFLHSLLLLFRSRFPFLLSHVSFLFFIQRTSTRDSIIVLILLV